LEIDVNAISNPVLSIDLSDGAHFRFATIDEISEWLEREQSSFQWLIEGGPQAGAGVSGLRNSFVNSANTLRQHLNQWRSSPDNEAYKQQFADTFRSAYSGLQLMAL
jgi:hypothetical protein